MKTVVQDLVVLQENNLGVLPAEFVYETIEGSGRNRSLIHGSSEMPVWGYLYMAKPTIRRVANRLRHQSGI